MKCEKASLFLADYVQNRLDVVTRWRIARHIGRCNSCASSIALLKNTLEILQMDMLDEPPLEMWQEIKRNVMGVALSVSQPQTFGSFPLRKVLSSAGVILVLCLLAWIVFPSSTARSEGKNVCLHWTFFNSDVWDFCNFFRQIDDPKLAKLTPKIEEKFKLKLKQELQLDTQDESRLFPLLKTFSDKMKGYWDKYGSITSRLSAAVEKNETNDLDGLLMDLHAMRKSWTDSRWRLINDVAYVLDKKQFARFLIFTERIPEELRVICNEISENSQ